MSDALRTGPGRPAIAIGCILMVAVCLFPFWWMVLSSFKTLRELYTEEDRAVVVPGRRGRLAEFSTEFNTDWGAVMAASVVMTLPIALLFLSMQRLFIGGLTAGATKG